MALFILAATAIAGPVVAAPGRTDRLVFPLHAQHNHASCIVECPNGDLLVCWYRGSGERSADDVTIMGARLPKGAQNWTPSFVLADTPGFPDCNPCMVIDPGARLWLFWPVILDNQWESALLRYASSTDYQQRAGPPKWNREGVVLLKPGQEFTEKVAAELARAWAPYVPAATPQDQARLKEYLADRTVAASQKLRMRLGWMPRPHPVVIDGGRMLLPLYSDLFDFSLVAYTDDGGRTWGVSTPVVGAGNVQPSIVRRRDGTLVAYFRDNGPPPQRVMESVSADRGVTWSAPRDTVLPDPGAGVEAIALRSGRWVLINNDTEQGRHSLALTISDDEGRSWTRRIHLEQDDAGAGSGSYSYPSIIQARDGRIHATYSFTPGAKAQGALGSGQSIKHVTFTEAWMLEQARAIRPAQPEAAR